MLRNKLLAIGLVLALPPLLEVTMGCGVEFSACAPGSACDVREPEESFPNSYVCSCSCTPEGFSEESHVVASEDDSNASAGGVSLTLGDVLMRGDGALAGMRFQNVMVPPGAVIEAARVEFRTSGTDATAVEFAIHGEASADAAPFTAAVDDMSSRTLVGSSVASWVPGSWAVVGDPHQTPDLAAIVQDIIDVPGWAEGNALVLIVEGVSATGRRRAYSYDGSPLQAPVLHVDYTAAAPVVNQDVRVCALAGDNGNLGGSLDAGEPQADCEGRVTDTLTGLADGCGYPSDCSCTVVAGSADFAGVCDDPCAETPLDPSCTNFDPVGELTGATNASGDDPVCVSSSPLAFAVFGRRSECVVTGAAMVDIDDESALPAAGGIVRFLGDPCPGQSCAVGVEYDVDIGSVTFGNVFGSETFSDLAGVGASLSGADAVLSALGYGTFGTDSVHVSARGVRDGEQGAVVALNDDVISAHVVWGSVGPMCSLAGSLIGSVDPELERCENAGPSANQVCSEDSDCTDHGDCSDGTCNCETVSDADLTITLALQGPLTNQPPTADAGPDQTVECPAMGVLDASGSSDFDSNTALYSWRRGSRVGPEVGFRVVEEVAQGLGTESYVLRVIDDESQADEDTTLVTVEDTTPPELSCEIAVPMITKVNHVMHDVGLTGSARDACEGILPVTVTVFGDEDDEMPTGDGMFAPDASAVALETLHLRGERRGDADGRVYLVIADATDSSGNRGFDCCTVAVPHSNSKAALDSAEAQAAAARDFCLANEGVPPAGYFLVGDGPTIGPKQCGIGFELGVLLPALMALRGVRRRRRTF